MRSWVSFVQMTYRHTCTVWTSSSATSAVPAMSRTLDALGMWMSSNRLVRLRLNSAKTKFIWLGTRQQLAKLDLATIAAEFPCYTFSATARDLDLLLDQELTLAPHLHSLSRNC